MIHLESAHRAPSGMTTISDKEPRAHWLLSNGLGWQIAVSQNNADFPPQVLATPAVIFVGLYHGTVAAVSAVDGRVIARTVLAHGNGVFWTEFPGFIVAEGEMSVGIFRPTGEFLWQTPLADVIAYIEIAEDSLRISDASGRIARHDLETGKIIG